MEVLAFFRRKHFFRTRSWAELRATGNSRAVQISVLFPLIGYLILFNDQIASFLSMSALDSSQGSWFDVVWHGKLYFVYFGLMAMGVGSAIYQSKCPYIIKKHGDWADYVRVDGDSLSDSGASGLGKALGHDYNFDCITSDSTNVTIDYMREWYSNQSAAEAVARAWVTTLFGLGFILLAIPSSVSAIKIFSTVLSGLFHRA